MYEILKTIRTYLFRILGAMLLFLLAGCASFPAFKETPGVAVEYVPLPTPADNLPELVINLSSNDPTVRAVSAGALYTKGKEAVIAVPALIDNLSHKDYEVRRISAIALGQLGPEAYVAVPKLSYVLQNESESYQVRYSSADALGKISDKTSIPALAQCIYLSETGLTAACANAIASITDEEFRDAGSGSFSLDSDGIPFIVIDARNWWEKEGQYMLW